MSERGYRVLAVAAADAEQDVAAVLDRCAAALAGKP
jgi:hypothetical protein